MLNFSDTAGRAKKKKSKRKISGYLNELNRKYNLTYISLTGLNIFSK